MAEKDIAELVNYETQEQVIPKDSTLIYSWIGIADAQTESKIDIHLIELFNSIGLDYCGKLGFILPEAARNLHQHAEGIESCFDLYHSEETSKIIMVTSSTGIDYSDRIKEVMNRKLPKKLCEAIEWGSSTMCILGYVDQLGFIENYKSPNSNFEKVQTAFYFIGPVKKIKKKLKLYYLIL